MDPTILNDSYVGIFFSFEDSKEQESSNCEYFDARVNFSQMNIEEQPLVEDQVKQEQIENLLQVLDTQINCNPEPVNEKENDPKCMDQQKQECLQVNHKSSEFCIRGPDCWYQARDRCKYYHPPSNDESTHDSIQENGTSNTEEKVLCRRGPECWYLIRKCCRYYHPPCHYTALHDREKNRKKSKKIMIQSDASLQTRQQSCVYARISTCAEDQDSEENSEEDFKPAKIQSEQAAPKTSQDLDWQSISFDSTPPILNKSSISVHNQGSSQDQSSKSSQEQSVIQLSEQLPAESLIDIFCVKSHEKLPQEQPQQIAENISEESSERSFGQAVQNISKVLQPFKKRYVPKEPSPAYQRPEKSFSHVFQQNKIQRPCIYGTKCYHLKRKSCRYFHPLDHFKQRKNNQLPLFQYTVGKYKTQISEICEKEILQWDENSRYGCWEQKWISGQTGIENLDDSGDSQISLRTTSTNPEYAS